MTGPESVPAGTALSSRRRVVVNGRFLTMPVTGVQRYGREVLARLPGLVGELDVVVPGRGRVPAAEATDVVGTAPTSGGIAGHRWEQFSLPRQLADDDLLVGFANWGPLRCRRQILTVFDSAPLRVPRRYSVRYRALTRALLPHLARRVQWIVTVSPRAKADLVVDLGLDPARVLVIPPGVGPPFTDSPEPRSAEDRYCVFVGGHDPRKNLKFLLDIWPEVLAATGLRLVVVARSASKPHRRVPLSTPAGVELVTAPDDRELASWYSGAACVLFPSEYEGFGLPLLEAAATGTPFVSTDVGAAAELASDPGVQIRPLERNRWIEAIGEVAEASQALGFSSMAIAARYRWETTAAAWAHLIQETKEAW